MGRAPCCDKANVKRGPWSPEEDTTLKNYIHNHGSPNNWIALPHKAGLKRCGKSCRLRWLNYLRPDIKHGGFTDHEDYVISSLYSSLGSRWSVIASQLPGRTDNDVKNYWNTKLKKKLLGRTVGLNTHAATANQFPVSTELLPSSTNSSHYHLETIDSQVPFVDHPIPQLPPLPSPPEGSDFLTNGSYSSGNSSSLGASSLSASSSLAMDSSWSGNGEEEFPMDLCFGFLEEQIKEVDDPTLGIPPPC